LLRFPLRLLPSAAILLTACGGGGALGPGQAVTAGEFLVLGINVPEGGVWPLNLPVRIEFNHPVAPGSVGLSSILFEGLSPEVRGRPVTGSFRLEGGGRVVVFQPTCPTSEALDNGGFLPGRQEYRVSVPASGAYGSSVLHDVAGHPLALGISRGFRTPGGSEPLFHDNEPHPPRVVAIE